MSKTMRLQTIVMVVGLASIVYGTISDRWFVDERAPIVGHEGILWSNICGPDVGDDTLEPYATSRETGVPHVPRWSCERTFHVTLITTASHSPAGILFWALGLIGVIAGLANAVLLTAGLAGRRRARYPTLVALVAIGTAIGTIALGLATDYSWSNVGVGAMAYLAGAIAALWVDRRGSR
jgi:hypothetical protein